MQLADSSDPSLKDWPRPAKAQCLSHILAFAIAWAKCLRETTSYFKGNAKVFNGLKKVESKYLLRLTSFKGPKVNIDKTTTTATKNGQGNLMQYSRTF